MKPTLILFGSNSCPSCRTINELISELKDDYNIIRINTISFFSKDGQIKSLGIDNSIIFINNFLQHLGNKFAALFKYNPETKELAYVDLEAYSYTSRIGKEYIKIEDFKKKIDNANYNVWPPENTE
ncbi:Thioredoxin-like protein [Eptesipox virus]|uniref:Glutaredoxin-2 n=1 Tax=Eptesipox virus TaxID=1329402 RepID=A0A220T6B6_9POXV|nr:Thioredoxin-like protein [Eptesipox virus]ASK51258.1 Thioredoxin-like protein [Eptesipox virus]WAH71016.1 thioredoxin-like protein [Eptesipox virus]